MSVSGRNEYMQIVRKIPPHGKILYFEMSRDYRTMTWAIDVDYRS